MVGNHVTGLSRASMTPDGSEINLFLGMEGGSELTLVFDRKTLESALRHISFLITQAKDASTAASTRPIVHALETTGYQVTPVPAEGKVLLTMVDEALLEHRFAIPASECEQFRADMREAEKKCTSTIPPPRH